MTSARIDFEGQYGGFGCCATQPFQLSRTKPAVLDEHMSAVAWNSFCDRIDETLQPLNKLRKISGWATCVFFAAFIAVPLAVIIPQISQMSNMDSSHGPPNVAAFIIGPLVAMVGLISTQCIVAAKTNGTMEELKGVCDEVSKQQPRLSFHVRFERYYYRTSNNGTSSHTTNFIEVIISGAPSVVPMATAIQPAVPYATATAPEMEYSPPGVSTTAYAKSPAERLEELEKMKPHLSEAEYFAKRNDILNSV